MFFDGLDTIFDSFSDVGSFVSDIAIPTAALVGSASMLMGNTDSTSQFLTGMGAGQSAARMFTGGGGGGAPGSLGQAGIGAGSGQVSGSAGGARGPRSPVTSGGSGGGGILGDLTLSDMLKFGGTYLEGKDEDDRYDREMKLREVQDVKWDPRTPQVQGTVAAHPRNNPNDVTNRKVI